MSNNKKKKILFLCTGNSARSQMAEGLMRHLHGEKFEAFSAGVEPKGIHPVAVQAMREIGIDIANQQSKHIDTLLHSAITRRRTARCFLVRACGSTRGFPIRRQRRVAIRKFLKHSEKSAMS